MGDHRSLRLLHKSLVPRCGKVEVMTDLHLGQVLDENPSDAVEPDVADPTPWYCRHEQAQSNNQRTDRLRAQDGAEQQRSRIWAAGRTDAACAPRTASCDRLPAVSGRSTTEAAPVLPRSQVFAKTSNRKVSITPTPPDTLATLSTRCMRHRTGLGSSQVLS